MFPRLPIILVTNSVVVILLVFLPVLVDIPFLGNDRDIYQTLLPWMDNSRYPPNEPSSEVNALRVISAF